MKTAIGRFRVMYETFWKIFFFINTPKMGWCHQAAYHVKAFIVYYQDNVLRVWWTILGRIVPFVQDTFSAPHKRHYSSPFSVPYKRHYSSQYLQSFSFLLKAIHCPDSTQWKLSRDMLFDGFQLIFGVFLKKNIFQNVPYIMRNCPLAGISLAKSK